MPDKGLGYFLSVNASGRGGGKALRAIDGLVFRYITRGVSDTDPPRADFDDAAAQDELLWELYGFRRRR